MVSETPDLTNLHVFGFKCYVHIPKETRRTLGPGNKLIPKAQPMIFVGYSETKKAWKCFDPITKIIHESIHVRFDNESTPCNPANGKLRFCVDLRKVNEATIKEIYPLPRIDDTLESLEGAK
jgi:hypothetical protein